MEKFSKTAIFAPNLLTIDLYRILLNIFAQYYPLPCYVILFLIIGILIRYVIYNTRPSRIYIYSCEALQKVFGPAESEIL